MNHNWGNEVLSEHVLFVEAKVLKNRLGVLYLIVPEALQQEKIVPKISIKDPGISGPIKRTFRTS